MKTKILQSRQRSNRAAVELGVIRSLPILAGSVLSPYFRNSRHDRQIGRVNNLTLTITMDLFITPIQFGGTLGDAIIYSFWNAG